ncbi:uncharacterized protein [Amphiura filiformis]|uniref:uncharacterized protein n=1 Tax=Amphiura filiformis TaxID=82378 RepID=UPI003B20B775
MSNLGLDRTVTVPTTSHSIRIAGRQMIAPRPGAPGQIQMRIIPTTKLPPDRVVLTNMTNKDGRRRRRRNRRMQPVQVGGTTIAQGSFPGSTCTAVTYTNNNIRQPGFQLVALRGPTPTIIHQPHQQFISHSAAGKPGTPVVVNVTKPGQPNMTMVYTTSGGQRTVGPVTIGVPSLMQMSQPMVTHVPQQPSSGTVPKVQIPMSQSAIKNARNRVTTSIQLARNHANQAPETNLIPFSQPIAARGPTPTIIHQPHQQFISHSAAGKPGTHVVVNVTKPGQPNMTMVYTTSGGQRTVGPVTSTGAPSPMQMSQPVVTHVPQQPSTSSRTVPIVQIPMSQSAIDNAKKCQDFLGTLIKLASNANNAELETARKVKDLVQNLIDDRIQPEEFTQKLQKEVHFTTQPYLVTFLKKSLPLLRQSLQRSGATLQGINPQSFQSPAAATPTSVKVSKAATVTAELPTKHMISTINSAQQMEQIVQKRVKAELAQQQLAEKTKAQASNNDQDDDIQLVEPEPITKVNSQAPLKRTMPEPITLAKRPRNAPAPSTPNMPTPSPVTPLRNVQCPSQSPGRLSKPATPKFTLKPVSIRRKRVHKRVQVDDEQAEALESEDESNKPLRFKFHAEKKNVSHSGTQVMEHDLCGGCCVCRQMKIKQEIEDGSITVTREETAIKHNPGMNRDGIHDPPLTSQVSHSKDSHSGSSPSKYMQKRFEILMRERNSYKPELERMNEEQAKENQGLSVNQLTKKLEDSCQKNEDLQRQLDKATSERNIQKKELELIRVSQSVSANEALNRSLVQLKDTSEECDMLRESRADLERRVNQFTKTLSEKLDVQSREIQDDFNKKLREARERAASAEVKADSLKEENKALVEEVTKLKKLLSQEEDKHRINRTQCKEWEEKTNAWKARLTETLCAKEELVEKAKKSEEDLAQVEGKYQELMKEASKYLQSQLDKTTSERNILKKDLENLRESQNVSANEVLNRSLTLLKAQAMLKAACEERDILRQGKSDLERRVNQLEVQSRVVQHDFNKKLREACEREANAVRIADYVKEQNKALALSLLSQEEDKHRIIVEKEKQVQETVSQNIEDCKKKVLTQCKEWEEKTNARLTETLREKEELVKKAKKSEADLAQVEGKYQELVKKQEVMEKELKDAKEKELKAAKVLAEVQQQHTSQLAQLEATRCRELADCRQELQVMVKEIGQQYEEKQQESIRKLTASQQEASDVQRQQHEEKEQDSARKLAAAQQEANDMQNKWEYSEKKANDLNQSLQSLRRQLNQALNQAQKQHEELARNLEAAQQEVMDMQNKWEDSEKKAHGLNQSLQSLRQELNQALNQAQKQHEEKEQDIARKLEAAQQEAIDTQNKWEDSEKKAKDINQTLQSLRQELNQARNQAQNQVLEGLRVNVYNLLKTLLDQSVLDNYVNDPRSTQVDDILERVLDDNGQECV